MTLLDGTLTRHSDGVVEWIATDIRVLGPITFEAHGVILTVEPADPTCATRIAAPTHDVLRSAAPFLIGDPQIRQALVAADDGARLAGIRLTDPVARFATIESVRRLFLADLDEPTLILDRAHAFHLAGRTGVAAGLHRMAQSTIELLLDEMESSPPSAAVAAELGSILQSLSQRDDVGPDRNAEFLRRIGELPELREELWRQTLDREVGLPVATTLGGQGAGRTGEFVDLRVVPPRILRFSGPSVPDLTVSRDGDGYLIVRAELQASTLDDCREVTELFAVATDPLDGEVLASGPCTAADGYLTARLWVGEEATDSLRCGLVSTDVDFDLVRSDETGSRISQIERYCRHAWTQHRIAGTALSMVGVQSGSDAIDRARREATSSHREAIASMDTAAGLARQLVRARRRHPDAWTSASYAESVGRLADAIGTPPETTGPARPTLAELYTRHTDRS